MNFAKLDTDREARTGFPEVIFCEGKPDEYLLQIYKKLYEKDGRVFGTRASVEQYEMIKAELPGAEYDKVSRILKVVSVNDVEAGSTEETDTGAAPYIAVCTGGTADIPVAEEAAQTAEYFGARVERIYDVGVSGLHRIISKKEVLQGACCTIAIAGMEGALASVIGGLVSNPVIAVPTSVGYGASFGGMSALLTMINSCANGITVVNIDNGYGAGYVATQIYRLAKN
ncbi:MAG: nickel pincer cofactor biosynthesis protein LarB [Eubacterium sp.]|nr:nickel pincer cofactor biosynthesis protein LarB [Eubacterium sp.]